MILIIVSTRYFPSGAEIHFNMILSTLWWNKLSSRRELTRRDFSRRFFREGQDVMTSNVACHAMLWTENSNEHPKTRDQQKHDIEIPQNRLVWSGSQLMIVQNGWIFPICEIYWEYRTAGHLVFWKPWPAVELKKVLSVWKHGFVFWAERKPNARLEIYKALQDRLTCLNRHMIV